jgi:outer membrane protein assembly factor BamA
MTRTSAIRILHLATVLVMAALASAQQATSRTEQMEQIRADKLARLWPEHTPGLVKRLNNFAERGLLEGARSGKGANGPQIVLGGMRSGNGTTFGLGYRRIDLWNERLAFRATARGTPRLAYMFDLQVESPRLNRDRVDLKLYTKYENSPRMDYYGPGPDSAKSNRSSYRLEDVGSDLEGRIRVWRKFYAGAAGGLYVANTGKGERPDFPSTDEIFRPSQTPGLSQQSRFLRGGGFVEYDWRDNPGGPRSGGHYYARHLRYSDQQLGLHSFNRLEIGAEQYIPYWNRTRVIAFQSRAIGAWARDGQTVPFYLQPTLGGNEFLRGFERYRFYDQSSFQAAVEHRWYVFSNMHAALFFEGGKVAPKVSQLNFHKLEYSGGIGFRFTIQDTVIMRIDNAVSREGYRFMWTFSNMW